MLSHNNGPLIQLQQVNGLALLVVDDEDIAEVVETVVPDFHPLLNAPWQKTGETIVSELLCGIRNSIH